MEQQYITLDIRTVLQLIRRNIAVLVIFTMVGAAVAYIITAFLIDPIYEASVTLVVNTRDEQVTLVTNDQINSARQLINTYSVILTNDALLEDIINQLNLDSGVPVLKNRISAVAVNQSQVMRMTVRDADPNTALSVLEVIMDRAPELLITTVKAGSVEIVSPPRVGHEPVSPSIGRNTVIGALAGLLITLAVVFIKKALVNTFVSEEDISRYLDLPVLGVIPKLDPKFK